MVLVGHLQLVSWNFLICRRFFQRLWKRWIFQNLWFLSGKMSSFSGWWCVHTNNSFLSWVLELSLSGHTPIICVLTLFPINLASSRACFLGSTLELDWRWSMSAELLALEGWFGHLCSQSVGGRCQCPRPLGAKPARWSKMRKKPVKAKQKLCKLNNFPP